MKRKGLWALLIVGCIGLLTVIIKAKSKCFSYGATTMIPRPQRTIGIYERYGKRILDIVLSSMAIIVLSPVYFIVGLMVRVKLGSPVLFTQERPGLVDQNGRETIFKMYKFRTMTDERDSEGRLLPDEKRLTKFGAWLRSTSLDELPELFNILNGTMSIIGPRPLLVRYLPYYTEKEKHRHDVRPGLTGLAQINGRNSINWECKFKYDLMYVNDITFCGDIKILIKTVMKIFSRSNGVVLNALEDFDVYRETNSKTHSSNY